MKVFVSGSTGFIGTVLVPELLSAGHGVVGMTRTEEGADKLREAGAEVHFGSLQEIDRLKAAVARTDAAIHLAFDHNFTTFQANCEEDRQVIEAMGEAFAGSDRPLLGTAGVLVENLTTGLPFDEDDTKPPSNFPRVSEEATLATLDHGVRGIVVRLSQIHDHHRQGLVSYLIELALAKGVSAYVGDGSNRWAAAHVTDTARLYRLALEKGTAGSKWHAVVEHCVALRDIAEAVGRRLELPVISISTEEASGHFGFLSHFVTLDSPTANRKTRERLGWEPTGPSLLEDLSQLVLP